MESSYRRILMLLIGGMFALHLADPVHASLAIRIESSTPIFADPASFELSVIIQNRGSASVVVLPQALRRMYSAVDSGSPTYSPYPGPPIAPWKGAFPLQPGESRTLVFVGMRDGDGIWKVDPGRYELRVRLSVSSEFGRSAEEHVAQFGAAVWQGDIQSPAILISYKPVPAD